MNEKPPLSVVREFPAVVPNQTLVDGLEALLTLARKGELRGLFWSGWLRDGSYVLDGVGRYSSLELMIGLVEMLKHEMLDRKEPLKAVTVETPDPPDNT
jgi:hypothetical protein